MPSLELKVPPPLVAVVCALAMWLLSKLGTPGESHQWRTTAVLLLALAGLIFSVLAQLGFLIAKTTINPTKPDAASTLVTTGIYSITRNPMYVGLAAFLMSYATYLAVPSTYLGPVALVLYVTRFQILPEEAALAAKFGPAYATYLREVRRWL